MFMPLFYDWSKKSSLLYITMSELAEKKHVRAVMLVLASNENQIVTNSRRVWKRYMNLDPKIKVFFVYGELHTELELYDETSDLIFPQIPESYPVLIHKTIEAMKYIHSKYTYDFFIRTNLSTFWDFKNLHKHLDILPKDRCYSGDGPLPNSKDAIYLSGVDTIVTYDMIDSLVNNTDKVNYEIVEDAAMGLYFNGVLKVPMLPNRICFFEDIHTINEGTQGIILHRIQDAIQSDKDHYRVKTNYNREHNDVFIYTKSKEGA